MQVYWLVVVILQLFMNTLRPVHITFLHPVERNEKIIQASSLCPAEEKD